MQNFKKSQKKNPCNSWNLALDFKNHHLFFRAFPENTVHTQVTKIIACATTETISAEDRISCNKEFMVVLKYGKSQVHIAWGERKIFFTKWLKRSSEFTWSH